MDNGHTRPRSDYRQGLSQNQKTKTKTTRPYLVYLSDRQTDVVLSLITVHDKENITMECNYIALGICIYIPYNNNNNNNKKKKKKKKKKKNNNNNKCKVCLVLTLLNKYAQFSGNRHF